ncbi:lycopene beta-cyclase CrtY [Chthonobacter rhizosphaerae]|uniref:lycopene beta-cyclase CrtY n=1 Tax=Chthonobacter rhizosphaerae TaxID=2735553 RepID=UPI0015EF938E|nr:lycopene beta-cyclase CrtY [Chthonobacter rhizosphaerae]
MTSRTVDVLLVGGGLANGLLALALTQRRPDLSVLVLEAGDRLGGNHTWSFHDTDLDAAGSALVAPLVAHRWPAQAVVFPGHARELASGYASVPSDRFHDVLAARLGDRVRLGASVAALTPTTATLSDGAVLTALTVIDGRGPAPSPHLRLGWQTFLGEEIRLAAPHGVRAPVIMDATVPQRGGYRFVYVLPFGPDRLLVEDTAYADARDQPGLDHADSLAAYRRARGWGEAEVIRRETGVLPITLDGDVEAFWAAADGIPRSGLRAGLFHPTTGYSLPDAARLALLVADLPDHAAPAVFAAIRDHAVRTFKERRFFRALNRMLFLAGRPEARVGVMERFYRLPRPLIERFYAARLTPLDKARLLAGKPPVPVGAALAAIAAPTLRRRLP